MFLVLGGLKLLTVFDNEDVKMYVSKSLLLLLTDPSFTQRLLDGRAWCWHQALLGHSATINFLSYTIGRLILPVLQCLHLRNYVNNCLPYLVTVVIYEDSRYEILIVVCEIIYRKEVIINILKLPMLFFRTCTQTPWLFTRYNFASVILES